jgi:hypothetical protein
MKWTETASALALQCVKVWQVSNLKPSILQPVSCFHILYPMHASNAFWVRVSERRVGCTVAGTATSSDSSGPVTGRERLESGVGPSCAMFANDILFDLRQQMHLHPCLQPTHAPVHGRNPQTPNPKPHTQPMHQLLVSVSLPPPPSSLSPTFSPPCLSLSDLMVKDPTRSPPTSNPQP